jgi:uncharacterized protein with FMN-binding domain
MAQNGGNRKIANGLVAVSSAAVMAVYAAGYTRTRSAADQFDAQAAARRPGAPRPQRPTSPVAEFRPSAREAATSVPSRVAPNAVTPGRDEADNPSLIASLKEAPPMVNAPPANNNAPGTAAAPSIAAPVVNQPVEPAAPVAEHKAEAPATAATVSIAPPPAAAPQSASANPIAPPWKDGTYYGWGTCRHGDLQAQVVIQSGKIASAKVSECDTRYSCDVIDILPPQVAQRQSPEIDNVSGATQSADAFYGAVYNALLQAK